MTAIHEDGIVEAVEGGRARIRIEPARPEACRRCRACDAIDNAAGGGAYRLHAAADDLRPGDRVTVEVPLANSWQAIALVLALPLAALVVGAVVGAAWTGLQRLLGLGPDLAAVATGVGLGAAAFAAAAWSERRLARRHPPRVTAVHRAE